MALSIGFRNSVSFLSAIQATGLLTFAPVGLSPTEHASLRWTHPRARLVQSRAALCASVVIIEGFLIYLQRCWLLGQVRAPRNQRPAGNTSTATAASGIVPAHCGPPTASGFHLCSLTLGSKEDRWRRATVMHAAGPLVVETLAVSTQQGSKHH